MKVTALCAAVFLALGGTGQLAAQTATDLVCAGCVGNSDIASRAVDSYKIKSLAVTSAKIRDGAVTLTKVVPQLRQFIGTVCPQGTSVQGMDTSGNFICSQTEGYLFRYTNYDNDGVVALTCPVGEFITSVSGYCDSVNGTRNFGVLFSTQIAGNGGVVGCFDFEYTPYLPSARANITIVCADQLLEANAVVSAVPAVLDAGISAVPSAVDAGATVEDPEFDAAVAAAESAVKLQQSRQGAIAK